MRRLLMTLLLLLPAALARAQDAPMAGAPVDIADATRRVVRLPDRVARVLPAGQPAAALLAALAPDLMIGWPAPPTPAQAEWLSPELAALPAAPHLSATGETDAAVLALKPDLILDYGTVSPPYVARAIDTQLRTGIATVLLDGRLDDTPHLLRLLGHALHREQRGELLARLAEDLLRTATPSQPPPRALYLQGRDTLRAATLSSPAGEVFAALGWTLLAPPAPMTPEDVGVADPDIVVFADPAMRDVVAASPAWRALPVVRDGRAYIAPALPFGWLDHPPSLNRLLGVAWLDGRDVGMLAAMFAAVAYGQAPAPEQLARIARDARPLPP